VAGVNIEEIILVALNPDVGAHNVRGSILSEVALVVQACDHSQEVFLFFVELLSGLSEVVLDSFQVLLQIFDELLLILNSALVVTEFLEQLGHVTIGIIEVFLKVSHALLNF